MDAVDTSQLCGGKLPHPCWRKGRVRLRAVLLIVGVLACVCGIVPGRALAASRHVARLQAPTCSQEQCNGTNPYATRCAGQGASYRVLDMAYLRDLRTGRTFGYVQLWFSATCQTNWARYVCLSDPTTCPTVFYTVQALSGAAEEASNIAGVTRQLYLPTTKAYAMAQLFIFDAVTGEF